MAAFINTNIASLNAQRNLTASQGSLQTSLQRLSSGLRINSAKDDAAGLAISSRFTTQIKGLDQAVRNANDGISLAQTGEGALGEVTNNLQRIRELAVQAGNATNSADDRAAIDLEVQQRLSEIDRTASQTAFNGQKILDGSFGNAAFQIGANAGETINVGLSTNVRIAGMGAAASVSSGVALSTLMNSSTTPAVAGSYTKSTVSSFDFRNVAATAATYTTAVTPTNYSSVAATAAAYTTDTIGAGTTGQTFNVTVGGGSAFAVTLAGNTTNATDLAAEITGTAGYASADFTVAVNAGKLQFTAKTAGAGNIAFSGADASLLTAGSVTDTAGTNVDNTPNKTFTLTAPGGSALSVTLNSNITSAADLATAIQSATGYGASGVVASSSGGNLVLTASAGGAGNIAVGGANASVITGGLVASGDVAGTAANDKRAGFSVDGHAISLTTDVTDQTGLVNAIRTQLNAAVGNSTTYTVAAAGTSGFSITSTTAGTTTPATVGTFTGAGSADFGGGTVVAGAASIPAATLTLGAGDLSIQIGNSSAVAITGTFSNSTQLVNAINSSVQGVYASVNASNGKLDLTSSQDITLSGANAGAGATELAFATTTNAVSGNLSTANVKTVAGANDIIQRVDNALSTVSTLRSTFGAVQNRFESVISNLSSTSENLSAARSRIQDADFASETATLTRGQILQQAGTAMLAQANSLPNGVLALLRG